MTAVAVLTHIHSSQPHTACKAVNIDKIKDNILIIYKVS